jgi:hypothetical protein
MSEPTTVASRKIMERDFSADGSYRYARASLTLPLGWTLEDALRPEFWSHVAKKFSADPAARSGPGPGSIIEVRNVENTLYAELFVRAVRERDVMVEVLSDANGRQRLFEFGPKTSETEQFEIRWNVGKRGYDVLRKSDRQVVGSAEKFPLKEQALAWVAEMNPVKKAA